MSDHDQNNGRLVEYLRRHVAFARLVGLEIDEVRPGSAVFHVDVGEEHMNGAGAVHGGVHATLCDSAMAVALISLGLRVATTQMTMHYLAPVAGGRMICSATVAHRSRRSALVEARIHDAAGRLLASASGAFHIFNGGADDAAADAHASTPNQETHERTGPV